MLGHGRVLLSLEVLLGSSREIRLGNSGLSADLGGCRAATDELLGLGSVVAHVLLGELGGVRSVSSSNHLELLSLGVENLGGILNVVVDELLVGSVDQREGEEHGGAKEGESPVGNNLDEPVREEGRDGNLQRASRSERFTRGVGSSSR